MSIQKYIDKYQPIKANTIEEWLRIKIQRAKEVKAAIEKERQELESNNINNDKQ